MKKDDPIVTTCKFCKKDVNAKVSDVSTDPVMVIPGDHLPTVGDKNCYGVGKARPFKKPEEKAAK
ncbi:hypothetical protein HON59_02465 [bacterium]|jgi:hypothetical protein|nr:hypothetical protein [bacterium]MBT3729934.1 hypothetical protein [bacterium]MBT4894900.1 hypothetical protein [bacterium]